MKHKNVDGIQHRVQDGADQYAVHGQSGTTVGPRHVGQGDAHHIEGGSQQKDGGVVLGVGHHGLSRAEHLVYVVLPACREWLWGAALLGFGRAAGDTMIPTMLAGNAVQYPASPFEAIRTLTAHIGLVLSSDVGGTAYYSLFVAGGILLALSTVANILFRAIRRGSERG